MYFSFNKWLKAIEANVAQQGHDVEINNYIRPMKQFFLSFFNLTEKFEMLKMQSLSLILTECDFENDEKRKRAI